MSSQLPPVPPAARSNKGPGGAIETSHTRDAVANRPTPENLEQQDRQGNIKQNTTNKGHQQDR
jgi:hypothetical protein